MDSVPEVWLWTLRSKLWALSSHFTEKFAITDLIGERENGWITGTDAKILHPFSNATGNYMPLTIIYLLICLFVWEEYIALSTRARCCFGSVIFPSDSDYINSEIFLGLLNSVSHTSEQVLINMLQRTCGRWAQLPHVR
jgi:hypothetical protein